MKRLFIIASLAILAVGCQKTEIQNEVQTPIGFSTETGKLTRAIVTNGANGIAQYPEEQPFGVIAYAYQLNKNNDGSFSTERVPDSKSVPMENIEISNDGGTWRATGDIVYYWPNDPRTHMDFYAYSPAKPKNGNKDTQLLAHQELTGIISHSEQESNQDTEYGLVLSNYTHDNMYVDFMVADPVVSATYANQISNAEYGVVNLNFRHEMTQISFVVKLDAAETTTEGTTRVDNKYPNIDFTIKSIVLNNVVSGATYAYNDPNFSNTGLKWTPTNDAIADYKIYPATSNPAPDAGDYKNSYGAPELTNASERKFEKTVVLRTDMSTRGDVQVGEDCPGHKFSTTPVTMIPQAWNANDLQSFTIVYEISGTGVAKEEIVKTFAFNSSTPAPNWIANKKITYTLTIGLKEITFAPSVTNWSEEDAAGSFEDDPSNV